MSAGITDRLRRAVGRKSVGFPVNLELVPTGELNILSDRLFSKLDCHFPDPETLAQYDELVAELDFRVAMFPEAGH